MKINKYTFALLMRAAAEHYEMMARLYEESPLCETSEDVYRYRSALAREFRDQAVLTRQLAGEAQASSGWRIDGNCSIEFTDGAGYTSQTPSLSSWGHCGPRWEDNEASP